MSSMFDLSSRDRAFIIAEAGTCHAAPEANERFGHAMRYVHAAHEAGANCVKFQIFDDTELFCPYPGDEQRKPRWRDSWLHVDDWRQIKEFAEACGMVFLASVFQHSTVRMLRELGVEATKVASRAAKKFPYVYDRATMHPVDHRRITIPETNPTPFLISTGMEFPKREDAIYLECESVYPSTKCWSGEREGFSDHSGNPWRAIDAISRGCKLIEVHFYIDPIDAGPDLPASLNLDQLKTVCEARDAFAELRSDE